MGIIDVSDLKTRLVAIEDISVKKSVSTKWGENRIQVTTLDENTHESDLALTWADLVHEHISPQRDL